MRKLDTHTLAGAAKFYSSRFLADSGPQDRDWVVGQLYNIDYKDEFSHITEVMRQILGPTPLADFNDRLKKLAARKDSTFEKLLKDKLAINPDGEHIPGTIGNVVLRGKRIVGRKLIEVEAIESIRYRKMLASLGRALPPRLTTFREANELWPIYAGETEERLAGDPHGVCDPLPEGTVGLPVGALATTISNDLAIVMCNGAADILDEGTGAGILEGWTGAQPANPDVAAGGTRLFTCVYSATAFGAAVDDTGKATATAAAITPDTALATGTVVFCRASSSNDGATALDDHIDGEAGTSGSDFNFSNTSIVSGTDVDVTSHTLSVSET